MSTLKPLPISDKATIASLIDLVAAHTELAPARQREIVCALNTLARVLNREPHMIVATTEDLRGHLNRALPAACRVNPKRWANVKSLLRPPLKLRPDLSMRSRG